MVYEIDHRSFNIIDNKVSEVPIDQNKNSYSIKTDTDDTISKHTSCAHYFIQDDQLPISLLENEVQCILEAYLYRKRYKQDKCGRLAKDLSTIVRSKVKDIIGDRLYSNSLFT